MDWCVAHFVSLIVVTDHVFQDESAYRVLTVEREMTGTSDSVPSHRIAP